MFEKWLNQNKTNCKHEWQLISKTYAPPLVGIDVKSMADGDKQIIQKYLSGVTTLLFECQVCHELKKEEVLGTDENHLYEICEKVDSFGLQIVKYNDKMYGVGRYLPEENSSNIPLK